MASMLENAAVIGLILAAIPCLLYIANFFAYRRLPLPAKSPREPISVLIPARNEEGNIAETLEAILAHTASRFEVIVLDDHSTDRTADIVREMMRRDPRVRLEAAPPLPSGWCGKQHACYVLAQLARFPLLLFIDADVRLASDALPRLVHFMQQRPVALASGLPRQELGTFTERLLLPLIHTVLLGFLPLFLMRRTRWAAMSGGCGQVFVARKDAYFRCGGHLQIKASLHDGIKLPRAFRRAGFDTDLFDLTDLARCRMYHNGVETRRGLEKNATEALAAPALIVPMTLLLLGGQVMPVLLLLAAPKLSDLAFVCAVGGTAAALIPRLLSVPRFQQPLWSVLLHPLAICDLVFLQWRALAKYLLGRPAEWKGRSYRTVASSVPLVALLFVLTGRAEIPARIDLRDQFDHAQKLTFPAERLTVLTVADRKGSEQVQEWISALKPRFSGKVEFCGIAQVESVPRFLQSRVRKKFQETQSYPVMMDWTGEISKALGYKEDVANILVLSRDGKLLGRYAGALTAQRLSELTELVERHLVSKP